jgi:putative endonuclease
MWEGCFSASSQKSIARGPEFGSGFPDRSLGMTHQPPRPTPPPPRCPNRAQARGRSGEEQAAVWYAANGYQIIERNWRSRIGEIDLICARGNTLVFCEVKSRRSDRLGAPLEAVTRPKQIRLRRLAAEYLFLHTCGGHDVRFDVAGILGQTLTVVEAAF